MRAFRERVRTALVGLTAASAVLAATLPADAQEIVVGLGAAGTPAAVAPGGQIEVPIVVDVSGTIESVASVSAALSWNPAHFQYVSTAAGPFGTVTINEADAASGALHVATYSASGATSSFVLARVTLQALAPEGTTAPLGLAVTGIGNESGRDLSDITLGQGLFLCVSEVGLWGDVNGDGAVNIIDAQQVARHSVGMSVADPTALQASGDVNSDASINILDAQQIARYSVGLPTDASRVGELAGTGCSEPAVDELRLDIEEAQVGVDSVRTLVARTYNDSVAVAWPGGTVTWRSTDPTVAGVTVVDDSTAQVTGLSTGTTHIVATLDGLMAPAARITVTSGALCTALDDFVVGAVGVGGTVNGTLTTADCLDSEYYVHGWTLDLAAQDTVQIDLESVDFDGFLYLLDTAGEVIAQDDDSGVGTDAALTADLAAGSYYVMASTALAFETGAYALTVAPGVIETVPCSTDEQFVVGTIGVNSTTGGTLESADCAFDDGTLAEAWELELLATTSLRFDLTSVDFNPYLILTHADGSFIAGNEDGGTGTDAMIARTLEAGTYRIFVNTSAAGEAGLYDLSVTQAEVGPSCTTIGEFFEGNVAAGEMVGGTLTTTDCLDDNWYTESWTLQVSGNDTLRIDLASIDFDAYLLVMDDTMGLVATDNNSAGGTDARLTLGLAPGTYHVLASTLEPYATGSYTLSVMALRGAGSPCTSADHYRVGAIGLNTTEPGSLGSEDCQLDDGSYIEAWELNLAVETGVRIDLTSTAFDPYLILTDGNGVEIAANDDTGAGLDSRIDRLLPAGTYYLYVNTLPGGAGAYQITATEAAVGPSCSALSEFLQGSVNVGASVSTSLTTSDCLNDNWYTQAWTLDLATADTVQFGMFSSDFQSLVYAINSAGEVVGYGFAEAAGGTAAFTADMPAGTYHVLTTSNLPYETGSYTLDVLAGSIAPCSTIGDYLVGSVTLNTSHSGTLDTWDCQLDDGSYAEIWELQLDSQMQVVIDLTSSEFDTYLRLWDASGALITYNDDGGEGYNSRITLTLSAGTYYVVAETFSAGATGAYQIRVTN